MYIYHYYLDFENKKIKLHKESYENRKNGYIYISTHIGDHILFNTAKYNTVVYGKYIIMKTQDDEKARELFLDYIRVELEKYDKIIEKLEAKAKFISKYSF